MKGSSILQIISSFALSNFGRSQLALIHSCTQLYAVGKILRENSKAMSTQCPLTMYWTNCEQVWFYTYRSPSTYIVDHLSFLPPSYYLTNIWLHVLTKLFFIGGRKWKYSRIILLWFLNRSTVGIFIPGVRPLHIGRCFLSLSPSH